MTSPQLIESFKKELNKHKEIIKSEKETLLKINMGLIMTNLIPQKETAAKMMTLEYGNLRKEEITIKIRYSKIMMLLWQNNLNKKISRELGLRLIKELTDSALEWMENINEQTCCSLKEELSNEKVSKQFHNENHYLVLCDHIKSELDFWDKFYDKERKFTI